MHRVKPLVQRHPFTLRCVALDGGGPSLKRRCRDKYLEPSTFASHLGRTHHVCFTLGSLSCTCQRCVRENLPASARVFECFTTCVKTEVSVHQRCIHTYDVTMLRRCLFDGIRSRFARLRWGSSTGRTRASHTESITSTSLSSSLSMASRAPANCARCDWHDSTVLRWRCRLQRGTLGQKHVCTVMVGSLYFCKSVRGR